MSEEEFPPLNKTLFLAYLFNLEGQFKIYHDLAFKKFYGDSNCSFQVHISFFLSFFVNLYIGGIDKNGK